jgi:hypothetical protein
MLIALGMAGATMLARWDAIVASLLLASTLVAGDAWSRRLRGARSPTGASAWILATAVMAGAFIAGPRDAPLLSTLAMGAWVALLPPGRRRSCGSRTG